jgi:hypothetical protein
VFSFFHLFISVMFFPTGFDKLDELVSPESQELSF